MPPGEQPRSRPAAPRLEGQLVSIPAREGRALHVPAGRSFRVIDTEGSQVADLFAFCADDMSEYLSAEYTRVEVSRLFPRVGEVFVTNRRRPILAFVEDASPGIHDMLAPACDQTRYAALGVPGWHASCDENLRTAMRELGHEIVVVPQSINVFMNVRVGESGSLSWEPAPTSAGDSVTLRAELDCIVAVSACPQDIAPTNDGRPTPVAVELLVRPGPG